MRARAQSRLLPGLVRLYTSSSAACEQAGFPSWLGAAASSRVSTPLTKPLPGTQQKNGYAVPLEPPPTEVTQLPNGVRIVSEASTVRASCRAAAAPARLASTPSPAPRRRRHRTCVADPAVCHPQGPISSLGIYVNSGSVYETPETTGACTAPPATAMQGVRAQPAAGVSAAAGRRHAVL